MRIKRPHLTVLLDQFVDRGDQEFVVEHPADEIGGLLSIRLGEHDTSTVRFMLDADAYADAPDEVRRTHPEAVAYDLPEPGEYLKAILASGLLNIANPEEAKQLLSRYGNPVMMAGHPPGVRRLRYQSDAVADRPDPRVE